jgi:hypothetical protein
MKWILFLAIVGHDPGTGGHWEFDTQADCEQAAIAFLSIWPTAVNGRSFPGISFECKSHATGSQRECLGPHLRRNSWRRADDQLQKGEAQARGDQGFGSHRWRLGQASISPSLSRLAAITNLCRPYCAMPERMYLLNTILRAAGTIGSMMASAQVVGGRAAMPV